MSRTTKSTTTPAQAEAAAGGGDAPQYPDDVVVRGRLTADPQLRHTATSGKPVTTIRIAVRDGEGTTYHRVVAWGRLAEVVAQYLKKGRLVEVKGRPQERTYQDEDGAEHSVSEIVAYTITFVRTPAAPEREVEDGRAVA
jgi:single-strand DNA-binding protein